MLRFRLRLYRGDPKAIKWLEDGKTIVRMAIPVSKDRFTCQWWNSETGDCEGYADRPKMCRDYGVAEPCTFSETCVNA